MSKAIAKHFSPATLIALVALFVALGGTTYAATGGTFILGTANSADATTALSSTAANGPALAVANTGGRPAASFTVNAGSSPFSVSSATKVPNLNADSLDGLDSSAFLRSAVPLNLSGSQAGSILNVTNSNNGGSGNAVAGTTDAALASGVYGENSGGGYGIAGRNTSPIRGAVFGQNTGGGPALELHTNTGVPPMSVDSSAEVANLKAQYATNAALLGGISSAGFVQGGGRTYTLATTVGLGGLYTPNPPVANFFNVWYRCPADSSSSPQVYVESTSPDPVNVFHTNRLATSDDYWQVSIGSPHHWSARAKGDVTTLLVQGTPFGRQTVATVEVGSAVRSYAGDCHLQIQALITQ